MKKLTTKEAMQALLDGETILSRYKNQDFFYRMREGVLEYHYEECGEGVWEESHDLEFIENMFIYEPLKQKKKVTLYRYLLTKLCTVNQHSENERTEPRYKLTEWACNALGGEVTKVNGWDVLKTETKEVEYEVEADA